MRNVQRIVRVAGVIAAGVALVTASGCGKGVSQIEVQYTSGTGMMAGAFDKSGNLEISNPSFDGTTVVFTYKNTDENSGKGYVYEVIIRTYTADGVEVDKVQKTLYPGEITLPCSAKIVSVATQAKQQAITRVVIEHVGSFSMDRFSGELHRRMGL